MGTLRYENDHYIGGNSWVLAGFWMAQAARELSKIENVLQMGDFNLRINKDKYSEQLQYVLEGELEYHISFSYNNIPKTILLDKINEKGISSLSGFEKEILDEYSKN
jgi:hypothetical protein